MAHETPQNDNVMTKDEIASARVAIGDLADVRARYQAAVSVESSSLRLGVGAELCERVTPQLKKLLAWENIPEVDIDDVGFAMFCVLQENGSVQHDIFKMLGSGEAMLRVRGGKDVFGHKLIDLQRQIEKRSDTYLKELRGLGVVVEVKATDTVPLSKLRSGMRAATKTAFADDKSRLERILTPKLEPVQPTLPPPDVEPLPVAEPFRGGPDPLFPEESTPDEAHVLDEDGSMSSSGSAESEPVAPEPVQEFIIPPDLVGNLEPGTFTYVDSADAEAPVPAVEPEPAPEPTEPEPQPPAPQDNPLRSVQKEDEYDFDPRTDKIGRVTGVFTALGRGEKGKTFMATGEFPAASDEELAEIEEKTSQAKTFMDLATSADESATPAPATKRTMHILGEGPDVEPLTLPDDDADGPSPEDVAAVEAPAETNDESDARLAETDGYLNYCVEEGDEPTLRGLQIVGVDVPGELHGFRYEDGVLTAFDEHDHIQTYNKKDNRWGVANDTRRLKRPEADLSARQPNESEHDWEVRSLKDFLSGLIGQENIDPDLMRAKKITVPDFVKFLTVATDGILEGTLVGSLYDPIADLPPGTTQNQMVYYSVSSRRWLQDGSSDEVEMPGPREIILEENEGDTVINIGDIMSPKLRSDDEVDANRNRIQRIDTYIDALRAQKPVGNPTPDRLLQAGASIPEDLHAFELDDYMITALDLENVLYKYLIEDDRWKVLDETNSQSEKELILEDSSSDTIINIGDIMGRRTGNEIIFDTTAEPTIHLDDEDTAADDERIFTEDELILDDPEEQDNQEDQGSKKKDPRS